MSEQEKKLDGPDLAQGMAFADVAEGSMDRNHAGAELQCIAPG